MTAHDTDTPPHAAGADGVRTDDPPPGRIRVDHLSGDRFSAAVRGHRFLTDQPTEDGGGDAGPTPTEFFVAALASCVAFYAARYLARHAVDPAGLAVTADFAMAADRPARVASCTLTLDVPPGLDPARYPALLAVASHCTVHNSLRRPPEVHIDLHRREQPE